MLVKVIVGAITVAALIALVFAQDVEIFFLIVLAGIVLAFSLKKKKQS